MKFDLPKIETSFVDPKPLNSNNLEADTTTLKFNLPKITNEPVVEAPIVPVEGGISKYDIDVPIEGNLEEYRADRQGIGESLMHGAGRFITTVPTKALSGISSLGELIVNTGRAISEGSMDPYADTPVSDAVNKIEDGIKNSMPIYNTRADQSKNFLQRAFTDLDFWTNDMSDGAAFMASAWLTGWGGTKLLGPLTKAAYAAKLEQATAMGLEELSAAEAAGASAEQVNQIKFANGLREEALAAKKTNIDKLTMAGLSRTTESLMEGKQSYQTTYNDLINKTDENGNKKYSEDEAKNEAAKSAMLVSGLNMLLLPLDYDQYSGWFKTFSKSRDALFKVGAEGALESTIPSFGKALAKHAGRNIITEGVLEEGLQQAFQTYAQKKYNGDYGVNDIGPIAGSISEYLKGFTTKEGWDAMGAGMILGGLFGGITEARGEAGKGARDRVENLKKLIADHDYIKQGLGISPYLSKDPNTGKPVLNEQKILDHLELAGKNGLLSEGMVTQLSNNYEEAYKTLDNMRFSNWAFTHFEAGMGEHLMQKIDELGTLSDEELQKQGILGEDMKNSDGKLVTSREIAQRYKEKAIQLEKLYNQVSSRFEIPNRAVLKNIFDEAVIQQETTKSLEKINNKITNLRSEIAKVNYNTEIENAAPKLPESINEKELKTQLARKQDLINTLRDSYQRLDSWTNPKKLAAREEEAKKSQQTLTKNAAIRNLANRMSDNPNYKMTKAESKFYNDNKESVDELVVKKPGAKPGQPGAKAAPIVNTPSPTKEGIIKKPGQPGQVAYKGIKYENGFPIYTVINADGSTKELSSKDGWAPVGETPVNKSSNKEFLHGRNHFSNLFKYRQAYEEDLISKVKLSLKRPDGSDYSKNELIEMYPNAFPSLRALEILKEVMTLPNWKEHITLKVDRQYTEAGEPIELKSGLFGNRPELSFVIGVRKPGTQEVTEIHSIQNPYFYSYKDADGNYKLVDFTNITLDQFNDLFEIGYESNKPKLATQKDLDAIKQQWFDLKEFVDKVNAWYGDNNLNGSQPIPDDWYSFSPTAALDIVKSDAPFTSLSSVEKLKEAPIRFTSTGEIINNVALPANVVDSPISDFFPNAYFVLYTDPNNGYQQWVRVTPKKILSGEEIVSKLNDTINKLYEIDPTLVGTPEGDDMANAIVQNSGIYLTKTLKDGSILKSELSVFRKTGKPRYYLQLEVKLNGERGKTVFELNGEPLNFTDDKELNKRLNNQRDKLFGIVFSTKSDFRQAISKDFKGTPAEAAELFDVITTPNVTKDYTVKFNFGNELPEGMSEALGLAGLVPKPKITTKTTGNNQIDEWQKEIDEIDAKLAEGKLSDVEKKNLINKKSNRLEKIKKAAEALPIEIDDSLAAALNQFTGQNINTIFSEFLGTVMTEQLPFSPKGDINTDEEVIIALQDAAKSPNKKLAALATEALNQIAPKKSTKKVDEVDEMLERFKTVVLPGGKTIKTPNGSLETAAEGAPLSTDVPEDVAADHKSSGVDSKQEEIAKEVARRKENKKSSDSPFDKVGYLAPGEAWTIEQAVNWLKARMPQGLFIEEISPLMSKLSNGKIRYGYFKGNIVALTNNAPRTLAFHESFHVIFRGVLNDIKRKAYINKIAEELNLSDAQKNAKIIALRKSNPENYAGFSNSEMLDRVYEEEIADKYADWQNKRGTHRSIWQKLFDLIQRVVDYFKKDDSLDGLFRKIERGAFAKSNINPNFEESADKVLGLLSPVKSQEVIYNVAGAFFNKLSNGQNVTVDDILDDFERLYDPGRPDNINLLKEHPEFEDPLHNMYYVFNNNEERALIKEQFQQLQKAAHYNPVVATQEEFDGDSEANSGSDTERVHDKSSYEYDAYEKLGAELKKFFGTTTYQGYDDFGNAIIKALDPRATYAKLLPLLSVSHTSRNQLMPKLEMMAKTDNQIRALYDRLVKVSGYSEETPGGVGNGTHFLNRFKLAFQVYQYLYTQTVINSDTKEVKAFYLNKSDIGQHAVARWENEYRQYVLPKMTSTAFKDKILKALNTSLQNWTSNPAVAANMLFKTLQELKIAVTEDYVNMSLQVPGFEDTEKLFEDSNFVTKEDIEVLRNLVTSNKDIFEKGKANQAGGMVTRLKNIAAGAAGFDATVILPTFTTPENTIMYSYSEGNLALMASAEIVEHAKNQDWIKSKMADIRFKWNPFFSTGSNTESQIKFAQGNLTNAEVSITGMVKDESSREGVSAKNLDVHSLQMNIMALFGNRRNVNYGPKNKQVQSLYWLTQVGDKNTQIAASLPNLEYAIINEDGQIEITALGQDHLFKMFLMEEQRLADQKSGKHDLGYLNESRVYFEYLEGIKLPKDFLENPYKYKNIIVEQIISGLYDSKNRPNGEGLQKLIDQFHENTEKNFLQVGIDKTVLKDSYENNSKLFNTSMFINDFIWTNSYLQLLGLDLASAKNYDDFVKRMALLIASGPSLNSEESNHIITYTKEVIEYVDKDTFERLDQKSANSVPIKSNDAQVHSIPQSLLLDLKFQGKIDDATISAFNRLINPLVDSGKVDKDGNPIMIYSPLTAKEIKLLDLIPKKEVIAGFTKEGKVVYQKMAVAFLTKNFTSSWNVDEQKWEARPGYEDLHNKREHLEKIFNDNGGKSTVHLAPQSASKLYFPKNAFDVNTFTNSTSAAAAIGNMSNATSISNKYRREQVINATKIVDNIIYSLQQHAISGSELLTQAGKDLKSIQEETYAALKNDAFETASNLVRSVDSNGEISRGDLELFLESMRNQILNTMPDSQLYEFLKSDGNGDFKYSPDLVHVSAKFESLFLSVFKESFRNKVRGRKATLQSDVGVALLTEIGEDGKELRIVTRDEYDNTKDKSIYKDTKKYVPRRLNFMSLGVDEAGNSVIKPAEIMMTRKTAEMMGINISDPTQKDYMKVISSRIPTQNYHSIMPSEIVDFLPEEYGDTVIGPKELVLMMGADFDVDALYTYMSDLWIDNGKTIKYGQETNPGQKYRAYRYWNLNNNKYLSDEISKRINADVRVSEVKRLLSEKKAIIEQQAKLEQTKDLLELVNILNKTLNSADALKGQEENENATGALIADLNEFLQGIEGETVLVKNALKSLGTLKDLYEEHTQAAFKKLSMPANFKEWQAKGSPVSRGELYNRLFDVNYKMFTQPELWGAYKQYLNTNAIDNAINKVDESLDNKPKGVRLGNSITAKVQAFYANAMSKALRGLVVSSNVAGLFLREKGVKLKEGITFINDEGDISTYTAYPTVDLNSSEEEMAAAFKKIRFISDTGSQMVGIVIDDPKDPKIYKLNWNLATLSEITDAISLGMPRDFVFKTFALPIFKEFGDRLTLAKRAVAPASGNKNGILSEMIGSLEGLNYSDILKLTKLYTEKEIEEMLTNRVSDLTGKAIDQNFEHVSKTKLTDTEGRMLPAGKIASQFAELSKEDIIKEIDNYNTSLAALKLLQKLSVISTYRLNTLTKVSSLNKQIGSSLSDVEDLKKAVEMLDDTENENNPFSNLKEAIYSSEVMRNNINNALKVRGISELYFTKQTEFFENFTKEVNQIVSKFATKEQRDQISRIQMSALVSQLMSSLSKSKDYTYLFAQGDKNSIVSRYEKLKDLPEFKNNPFIKWAFPSKYDPADKTSIYPFDTLNFDTFTKLDPAINERIIDGHESLVNSNNEDISKWGKDILLYFIVKDGMMFKSESPGKFISPERFLFIAEKLKELNKLAYKNNVDGIEEFFGKSMKSLMADFGENFFRHKAYQRYINFVNRNNIAKFTSGKKKGTKIFNIGISDNGITLEYAKAATIEESNKQLEKNNIPIKILTTTGEVNIEYPKYLPIYVPGEMGMRGVKSRYILSSVVDGKATYKLVKPFGDTKASFSPFYYSPEKNEELHKEYEKTTGKGGESKGMFDFYSDNFSELAGELDNFDTSPFPPTTETVSDSTENTSNISLSQFSESAPFPSEFPSEGLSQIPSGFSESGMEEISAGLKKFSKKTEQKVSTSKEDFNSDDIPTKCKQL